MPQIDEQLSIRIVRSAIDQGVNFMDNSWDYNHVYKTDQNPKLTVDKTLQLRMPKYRILGLADKVFHSSGV